jgi:hypothetical protein
MHLEFQSQHLSVECDRYIDIANDIANIDLAHDFFTSKKY